MTNFERFNERYKARWIRKDQLKELVNLTVLTKEEYEKITGDKFAK